MCILMVGVCLSSFAAPSCSEAKTEIKLEKKDVLCVQSDVVYDFSAYTITPVNELAVVLVVDSVKAATAPTESVKIASYVKDFEFDLPERLCWTHCSSYDKVLYKLRARAPGLTEGFKNSVDNPNIRRC